MKISNRISAILQLASIALLAAGTPAPSYAAPRAVLLTSMAVPVNASWINRSYFENAPFRLEKTFRKFFRALPEFEVQVVHGPDAYETWRQISSPETTAVFWVSHAGNFGLFKDVMSDIEGNNLASVFQGLHPRTQLLALVACKTNPILEEMSAQGYFKANPKLERIGTDELVDARPALQEALERALPRLREIAAADHTARAAERSGPACERRRGLKLTITRKPDPSLGKTARLPSVQVEVGGKLVTVLPSQQVERETQTEFWVEVDGPATRLRASQLKVLVNTGSRRADADPRSLGRFEIAGEWEGARWALFTLPGSDQPMGVSRNVYQFKGELPADADLAEMPAPEGCR